MNTHRDPIPGAAHHGRPHSGSQHGSAVRAASQHPWRLTALVVFVLAGVLFATTALNSKGLDLRAASVTDLDHVVRQERDRANELQQQVAALNAQVETLTKQSGDSQVRELQRQADILRMPAGFVEVHGPGVQVSLDDAPKSVAEQAKQDGSVKLEWLVVHQQDIQAVVNALWAGGAEAVTVQGQRIISTTGIKCVGNTVILHGVPYSPPYEIAAIGDQAQLVESLDSNDYIAGYQTFVDRYQLGYDVRLEDQITMSPFEGTSDLKHATEASITDTGRP